MAGGLAVAGLTRRFDDEVAVDGVDLQVEPGELCFLVGPSGCGKTILLECVAGLETPDGGTVTLDGRELTGVPVEERAVGLVFQEFETALFGHMTVAENVAFGLRQSSPEMDAAQRRERVEELLALFAIEETATNHPGALSGGQQQRVELARQLVRDTDAMLLDDPLADLDYKLQKRMERELRAFQREAEAPYLQVTHNQERALRLADRIVVMNHGRVEQRGTPEEIYRSPANAFVGRFVGDSNLLEGTVTAGEGDGVTLETPIGRLPATPMDDAIAEGTDGVLLLRPEAIELAASPPPDATTVREVAIADRTYTGEFTEFAVSVRGSGGADGQDAVSVGADGQIDGSVGADGSTGESAGGGSTEEDGAGDAGGDDGSAGDADAAEETASVADLDGANGADTAGAAAGRHPDGPVLRAILPGEVAFGGPGTQITASWDGSDAMAFAALSVTDRTTIETLREL